MASTAYDSYLDDVLAGNITKQDTYYAVLLTSTYTPNKATHMKRSDLTNEVSGAGYTAGGQQITPTFTKDTTNHKCVVTFGSIVWANSSLTARYAAIYKRRGGLASADELVALDDFGSDVVTSNQPFVLGQIVINLGTPT